MDKKEQAAQKFKERTASKRFKLPEGNTTFRVLPNAKGQEKAEYIEYRMHSNIGARNAYLRCGKNVRGEGDCWLCDTLIPKLEKSSKSSHKKAAEALKAKECFAVQIIYQSEGKWMGPTLWEMSPSVANKLLNVMSRRDVSHPEKGYNLTISRQGTTMTSTKYGDVDRDDEKSEVPEKFIEKLKSFGEVLRKYDEAVMKTEYYGHEQTEEDEEEEEETKKKSPEDEEEEEETPKSKKKPKDEDEEEEEEEAPKSKKKSSKDEEESEEEEEKPKSKKKPSEDEEEEEEAPKSKKKPKDEEEEEDEEKKKSSEEDEEDVEEDIPDLEEEEEEKPKSKKKPKGEEEEESEDEEEKPKSKKKKSSEDEEEEEETPKFKKKPKPADDDDE